jgi:ABC-2 type transport system permease protein
MAAVVILPAYFAKMESGQKVIGIVDETNYFKYKFKGDEAVQFIIMDSDLAKAKKTLVREGLYAMVYIPKTENVLPSYAYLYSTKEPNINVKSRIKSIMQREISGWILQEKKVDPEIIASLQTKINLASIKINDEGKEEKSMLELKMGIGYALSMIIYMFIFMFGAQVMRGVIEEKTNRIVEIIVSSVKPFQLMMGKIIGVALVGLTQFAIWVASMAIILSLFFSIFSGDIQQYQKQKLKMQDESFVLQNPDSPELADINDKVAFLTDAIESVNFAGIGIAFLMYFLGGYLLYSSLFAAIGAAVDNETDIQQFMLPITVPLIIGLVSAQFVMNNPDGPLSFWLSMFPFTSPVVMMVRIPFGVPIWELSLSLLLLIAGFVFTTWLAGRIYRTGILMYGKKASYQDLWKWIRW